jgi:hypothetical protein
LEFWMVRHWQSQWHLGGLSWMVLHWQSQWHPGVVYNVVVGEITHAPSCLALLETDP